MEISNYATKNIEVTSFYFRSRPNKQRFESYPRRMVLDGREYNFMESGMHYLVSKGQELVRLFDVSDGQNQYRLRLDEQQHWTLVNTKTAS